MTAFLSAGLAGIAQIVPAGIRDAFSPSHSGIVSAVLFREVTACRFSAISSRNPQHASGIVLVPLLLVPLVLSGVFRHTLGTFAILDPALGIGAWVIHNRSAVIGSASHVG